MSAKLKKPRAHKNAVDVKAIPATGMARQLILENAALKRRATASKRPSFFFFFCSTISYEPDRLSGCSHNLGAIVFLVTIASWERFFGKGEKNEQKMELEGPESSNLRPICN